TYAVADFDKTGTFSGLTDVVTLSEEVAEWVVNPFGNNPTPAWGQSGGCQSNLESGDPLAGVTQLVTMSNSYTYRLQELAFDSWFYRDVPSIAVNGWYSTNHTFTSAAGPCLASVTTLSISPTTMA